MAARGRKSVEQIATLSRHDDDKMRLNDFIDVWRRKENTQISGDLNPTCCCAVSTTLNSTAYLFGIGVESMFTGTSLYSNDIHNPWVITGRTEELPELAKFIRDHWEAMEVCGDRERINLIAPHVVYDATDLAKPPQLVGLVSDAKDNVRASIDDITIWSRPPRDKQRYGAVAEKEGEKERKKRDQKIENLKKFAKNCKELHDSVNEEIQIPQELKERRQKTRDVFNELYSTYYEQYKLPTLQLEQRFTPSSGIKPTTFATLFTVALFTLYSAFFSSNSPIFSLVFSSILFLSFLYYYFKVYPHPDKQEHSGKIDKVNYDNKVHYPFPEIQQKARDSKKDVFDQLVGQEYNLDFDVIMASDE